MNFNIEEECCRCDVELPNGKVCCHVHQNDPTKCPKFDKPSKDSWEAQSEDKALKSKFYKEIIESITTDEKYKVVVDGIKDFIDKASVGIDDEKQVANSKDEAIAQLEDLAKKYNNKYTCFGCGKEMPLCMCKCTVPCNCKNYCEKCNSKFVCTGCGKEVPFYTVCICGRCCDCECGS